LKDKKKDSRERSLGQFVEVFGRVEKKKRPKEATRSLRERTLE